MLDLKLLRNNIEQVQALLAKRGFSLDIDTFNALEQERKLLQITVQGMQEQRNLHAKIVAEAKIAGKLEEALTTVKNFNTELSEQEKKLEHLQKQIEEFLLNIPNLPHKSVPLGANESHNIEIRKHGTIKEFAFKPKSHEELGLALHGIDLEKAALLSGARFMVLKGQIARLHRALIQFMLDVHTSKHHYTEVYVPYLVQGKILQGTGQLPKFKEDLFCLENHDLWLIPTAEVPVTNLVREQILPQAALPLRFVCHSPCFRSEVGSYGKDTKGIMRRHQFDKVELVQVVEPENSYQALEELTAHAEHILQLLELPYRIVSLCTGDLGFQSTKTYDLEVWLPTQNTYREISSCSNTESFQARRMQAKFRDQQKTEFVHTLNGSGVAVGRALIAVIENYQDEHGRIHIPKALQPYMHDIKIID